MAKVYVRYTTEDGQEREETHDMHPDMVAGFLDTIRLYTTGRSVSSRLTDKGRAHQALLKARMDKALARTRPGSVPQISLSEHQHFEREWTSIMVNGVEINPPPKLSSLAESEENINIATAPEPSPQPGATGSRCYDRNSGRRHDH